MFKVSLFMTAGLVQYVYFIKQWDDGTLLRLFNLVVLLLLVYGALEAWERHQSNNPALKRAVTKAIIDMENKERSAK